MQAMAFNKFQYILAFVYVVFVIGSHAGFPSEDYWKSVLPNTPMPPNVHMAQTLEDVLDVPSTVWSRKEQVDDCFNIQYGDFGKADRRSRAGSGTNAVVFFLERDLHPGKRMKLRFSKPTNMAQVLPRPVADSIPFSSNKLPEILNKFSVHPGSDAAGVIKEAIEHCEAARIKGEEKLCATSLESMIDFSTSKLGRDVEAMWTNGDMNEVKEYGVVGVKRMPSEKAVVCHKMAYPYAVFYCHKLSKTVVYKVSLVAADGSKLDAGVATCHRDTAAWNPKHTAFKELKVKPGGPSVCHFLPEDHIAWISNKN